MHTIELTIQLSEARHELIVAELDDLGGLGFLQEGDELKAYFSAEQWTQEKRKLLSDKLDALTAKATWIETRIAEQDWNEPWEKSITPIQAGPFWVRPSWADADGSAGYQEIVIDPKMSFGTGHHETTRLILEILPQYVKNNDVVLDAGTGTAILAIAAIKLGASSVIAFDIDKWALENGQENIQRNTVAEKIDLRKGSFEVVTETSFDLILANINRNVLIQYAHDIATRLKDHGYLVLSGVLYSDRAMIEESFEQCGLNIVDEAREGEWWAAILQNRNNHDALSS